MLGLVAGFLEPTRGTITLDGEIVRQPGSDRAVVFQQFSLFPWKTISKNVEFGFRMRGIASEVAMEAARRLLSACGIEEVAQKYPHQLSGGMQQRAAIVRAVAVNPKVLLMDEPFGALDAQTRTQMQQILLGIWEGLGITVIFVTHDVDEAIYLADRLLVMTKSPGRIAAEIRVPFGRPRDRRILESEAYAETRREVLDSLFPQGESASRYGEAPGLRWGPQITAGRIASMISDPNSVRRMKP
jgi:NitT/TauT family transport system ATP-binding protein